MVCRGSHESIIDPPMKTTVARTIHSEHAHHWLQGGRCPCVVEPHLLPAPRSSRSSPFSLSEFWLSLLHSHPSTSPPPSCEGTGPLAQQTHALAQAQAQSVSAANPFFLLFSPSLLFSSSSVFSLLQASPASPGRFINLHSFQNLAVRSFFDFIDPHHSLSREDI